MPTDWEDHYQRQETPWDKGAASPGLVDFLTAEPIRGSVLAPGCGLGHDVRALAARVDKVVGIDIAPSAIAAAEAFPKVGCERYEQADLFALPEHLRGAFDWVWEHTCFCAIDLGMRARYVEAVASALKPSGQLLAVFYLDPGQALATDGPPFETTLCELDRLFSARFEMILEWTPVRTFPGRERKEWMRLLRRRDGG